jgi:hypothetical protein
MSKVWILAAVTCMLSLPSKADAQPFFETFDSYAVGSQICGQGGWQCWDNNPAANTTVVNTQSFSPSNSLLVAGTADVVHSFTGIDTGVWFAREWVFIPSTQTGESWFILLNTYAPGGPNDWSQQIVFCRTGCTTAGVVPGMVSAIGGSENTVVGTTPLILNQWVEIRVRMDFTLNQQQVFYNGVQFYNAPWTITAPVRLQTIDLFSNGSSNTFMDSVQIAQTVPVVGTSFSVE